MNKSKGFTIIELIVVIAIIAVLAAIVLVNVTAYINKGKDAAARGNLATLMTNGATYFDANSNYTAFGASSGASAVNTALATAGYTETYAYNAAGTGGTPDWCAVVTLKNTNTFCVDSTGAKLEKSGGTCTVAGGATCQ